VAGQEIPVTIIPADEAPVIFPNPSSGGSTLRFSVPSQQKVSVIMYAADGRMVKKVADRLFVPGIHYTDVDYSGLKAGLYFVIINMDGKKKVIRNILVE